MDNWKNISDESCEKSNLNTVRRRLSEAGEVDEVGDLGAMADVL